MAYSTTETVIQVAVLLFITVLSVMGNFFSIIVIYSNKQLRTPQYLLIFNLALSDVFTAIICMPFTIITAIQGTWRIDVLWCKVQAFGINTLFLCTILTMTLMTVEKYFSLARPFSRFVTRSRTKGVILGTWGFCFLLNMGPLLGWGRFTYNQTTLSCGIGYPTNTTEKTYLLFLATIGFIIPVTIMGLAYVRIYISVVRHSSRIMQYSYGKYAAHVLRLQKHLIATTLMILLSFLVCWTPFLLLIVIAITSPDVSKLPRGLGVVAFWCGYSASAWNPIIYLARNRKFREKGTSFFKSIKSWGPKNRCSDSWTRKSTRTCFVSWSKDEYAGRTNTQTHLQNLRTVTTLTTTL